MPGTYNEEEIEHYIQKHDIGIWIAIKLATPLAIALGGYWIQTSIAEQSAANELVTAAISVLGSEQADERAKAWAVTVVNRYSPVPLDEEIGGYLGAESVSGWVNEQLEHGGGFLIDKEGKFIAVPGSTTGDKSDQK